MVSGICSHYWSTLFQNGSLQQVHSNEQHLGRMGSIWNWRKSTRSQRLQFYNKVVFWLPGLFLLPYKYKTGKNQPDKIVYRNQQPIFDYLSLFLALVVDCLIFYGYFEALFGHLTKVESSIAICLNSAYITLNTGQWVQFFTFTRHGGINLANFILDSQFISSQDPSFPNEIISLGLAVGSVLCPLYMYPLILFQSWHFQGLLQLPMYLADIFAASLFGNSWVAAVIVRQIVFCVITTALVDACMRCAITMQVLFSILCAMKQNAEKLGTTFKNSTSDPNPNFNSALNFIKSQILHAAYHQIFQRVFAVNCIALLTALIYYLFLLISPAELPAVITLIIVLAGSLTSVSSFMLFYEPIQLHTLIQSLIVAKRKQSRCVSLWEFKFWQSMKPPRTTILNLCTLETNELLLIVAADVVLMGVINLLLAF